MNYKIVLYNGEPITLKEEQGKQVMSAWATGAEKIILTDVAIASSNIAAIEKIDEELDYPKLEMPDKPKKNYEVLNSVRKFLSDKFGWS